MNKKNQGITLIALVITIIILLILAGVSLNLIAGENGILTRAEKAVSATKIAAIREEIELEMANLKMQYYEEYAQGNTNLSFKDWLKDKIKEDGPINLGNGGQLTLDENGNIKYEDENGNKADITIDENGNIKIEIDQNKEEDQKTVQDLTLANTTFNIQPSDWTNGTITVTVDVRVDMTGQTLQTSILEDPLIEEGWSSTNTQTFNQNGVIHARLWNGSESGTYATSTINKIDTTKPVVVTAIATTNEITIRATDEASGIIGYAITEDENEPSKFTACESTKILTTKIEGKTQNKTYYVWVKDAAGNISEPKAARTGIVQGDLTGSVTSWNGTTATVTFTTTTEYYIQTQVGSTTGTWSEGTAKTATATAESGQTVYARLVDSSGQANPEGSMASQKPILKYQVKYNANGGNGNMENSQHEYGKEKNLTANQFTKEGHTFAGWSTSANGAKVYNDGQTVSNLSTTNGNVVELYAVWTTNQYQITISARSYGSVTPTSLSVEYGTTVENNGNKLIFRRPNGTTETVTATAGNYTGYTTTFTHWYSDFSWPMNSTITEDFSFVASFTRTAKVFTITLNRQSATSAGTTAIYEKYGTGIYKNSACTTQMTTAAYAITVPKRTGYTFRGYYTGINGSGTQLINGNGYITTSFTSTKFTGNATLYAKWTPSVYRIYLEGSTHGSCTTMEVYQKAGSATKYLDYACTRAVNSSRVLSRPEDENYTFNGGRTETYGNGYLAVTPEGYLTDWMKTKVFTGDTTLYQDWIEKCDICISIGMTGGYHVSSYGNGIYSNLYFDIPGFGWTAAGNHGLFSTCSYAYIKVDYYHYGTCYGRMTEGEGIQLVDMYKEDVWKAMGHST